MSRLPLRSCASGPIDELDKFGVVVLTTSITPVRYDAVYDEFFRVIVILGFFIGFRRL